MTTHHRRTLLTIATTLALLVSLVGVAHAQTTAEIVVADIPFDFVIEETTFPAGTYLIRSEDPADPTVMEIESTATETKTTVMTKAIPGTWEPQATDRPELVFHEVGDTFFLAEVWVPAHSNARAITTPIEESKLGGEKVRERTVEGRYGTERG